ncbi:MAG: FHA domain-containing protein [Uliginosibacterium sp.]|nr:FHA domain-containing protein [Uliginosibacterium sp.]
MRDFRRRIGAHRRSRPGIAGRARACDVVLPDEDASRRHALLRVLGIPCGWSTKAR